MKVIKPGKLSVLTRNYEQERQFFVGFSVVAFVPLGVESPGPILLPEVDLWKFAGKHVPGGVLDAGIPKPRSEVIVVGKAFTPGGAPEPSLTVRVKVGGFKKSLEVFGDRHWGPSAASKPRRFTEMPLDWAHAYGGPEYATNPLGKGHAEVVADGLRVWPLPNLEASHQRIGSSGDRPEPAAFGPIDISWPQRSALAGTYDQEWLENLFPGFARDMDPGIHNIAPRDQQREGDWAGSEAYRFEHMHPRRPILAGVLPCIRTRLFLSRSHTIGQPRPSYIANKHLVRKPPPALEEVPLALQTLWFFPDLERAVLIWHGRTRVAEEDGADVLHALICGEHQSQPKPQRHYEAALAARLDPKWGALAALLDSELLPEDLSLLPDQAPDEDQQLSALEGLTQKNQHRRMTTESQKARDMVASYGLDPDVHGPSLPPKLKPPPKLHQLPEVIARIQADAKIKQAECEAILATKLAEAERDVDDAKIPGFTGKDLRAEVNARHVGPPTFTADGLLAQLVGIAMECRKQNTIVDEIEDMIVDKKLYAEWKTAETNMLDAYRVLAHMQEPAPAMTPELSALTRQRVLAAVANREDFATLNFTGADLRGIDLHGADLTAALFESVNFGDADLRGCKLGRAVLAHADLTGARLDGAQLAQANLGKTTLTRTALAGADLQRAQLGGAKLEGADLTAANLTGATLMGMRLVQVDARRCVGENLDFLEVDLVSANFGEAKLKGAKFLKTRARGLTCAGAVLESATFLEVDATGADFTGADLTNARFVEGCLLDGAKFAGATLKGAFLRGSSLVGADLQKAVLDGADLCECDLQRARMYQASAREAKFEVSDLRSAELASVNLMGASLARARLQGADLRNANLHGADMARVRRDDKLRLDQALMTKVRVHPQHVEPRVKERRR
jgi:uncharacterized protein YjbI with pentapeptide repeats